VKEEQNGKVSLRRPKPTVGFNASRRRRRRRRGRRGRRRRISTPKILGRHFLL